MSQLAIWVLLAALSIVQSFASANQPTNQNGPPLSRPLTIPIEYNRHLKYYLEIGVGQPPQRLNVTLSTATIDSWLLSSACYDRRYRNIPKYHATHSSTSTFTNRNFQEQRQRNLLDLSGYCMQDQFIVNNGSEIGVKSINFAEIVGVQGRFSPMLSTSGVLSLAEPSYDRDDFGFVMAMYLQDLIPSPLYSLNLNPNPNTSPAGSLILGGIDPSGIAGEITYVPLVGWTSFELMLIDFHHNANNNNAPEQSPNLQPFFWAQEYHMKLDTTNDMILMPNAQHVNAVLGAEELHHYIFGFDDCNPVGKPDLVFVTIGFNITLTPQEYMIPSDTDDNLCFSVVQNFPTQNVVILGNVVLRKYYTIYDFARSRIGFAERPHQ